MGVFCYYDYQRAYDILNSNFVFLRTQLFVSVKIAQYYFQTSTKQLAVKDRNMELYVEEQPPWVFDHILDAAQEENGLSAVDKPMVVCQCKVHHRPRKDFAIHNHRALHNGMHPKNC